MQLNTLADLSSGCNCLIIGYWLCHLRSPSVFSQIFWGWESVVCTELAGQTVERKSQWMDPVATSEHHVTDDRGVLSPVCVWMFTDAASWKVNYSFSQENVIFWPKWWCGLMMIYCRHWSVLHYHINRQKQIPSPVFVTYRNRLKGTIPAHLWVYSIVPL